MHEHMKQDRKEREWGWDERTERVRDRNRERKSYSGNDVVAMETLSSDYSTGASWVFFKELHRLVGAFKPEDY